MDKTLHLVIDFTGGLELFFSNQRRHLITVPAEDDNGESTKMSFLITYLCNNLVDPARKDMFVVDGAIRPGVLVLINDADWELEGGPQYELKDNDNIFFVSTLHGG